MSIFLTSSSPAAEPSFALPSVTFIRRLTHHPLFAPMILLAYCAFLFFNGLNSGDLYRTEGLRAIVAAEMLRSGDWIVPTLYGQPLLTKPPGQYVAIALVRRKAPQPWPAVCHQPFLSVLSVLSMSTVVRLVNFLHTELDAFRHSELG